MCVHSRNLLAAVTLGLGDIYNQSIHNKPIMHGSVNVPKLRASLILFTLALSACDRARPGVEVESETTQDLAAKPPEPAIHVRPGEDIQKALDVAAGGDIKKVVVHAGTYRPTEARQALIWFNKAHDGLEVVADGEVILTSANPEVAREKAKSYPAIVNHVVYFGDGVGPTTTFRGFKITGANNFVTTHGPEIESTDPSELERTGYFYFDGGGIKVYGRSYPVLEDLEIYDNYSSPCGGGISIEHRGHTDQHVTIRNCVFRNNRVPITGAALDLLGHDKGSAALVENCLFVENASNCTMDSRSLKLGSWKPKAGHGAITLFKFSKAQFRNCTIVGNRNGVDDLSPDTTYDSCILWNNTLKGGWVSGQRYETAISNAKGFTNCFVGGAGLSAQRAELDPEANVLDAPDPDFDGDYVPRNPIFAEAGYRPASQTTKKQTKPAAASNTNAKLEEPITIKALGVGFNWYFSYAGADGELGTEDDLCTRRHLYVPVGRPVELILESKDYLYSFKLPKQGANEIAFPGIEHRVEFTESKDGTYPLTADPFCGYLHPDLIGRVIVQSQRQFSKSIVKNRVSPAF